MLNNPDIVAILHSLRAELIVNYIMKEVVPCDRRFPFLSWMRPEWGVSGNPHHHGASFIADNPAFESVVRDPETHAKLLEAFPTIDHDL